MGSTYNYKECPLSLQSRFQSRAIQNLSFSLTLSCEVESHVSTRAILEGFSSYVRIDDQWFIPLCPPPPQKRMHKSKDDRVVICKYAVVIKVVTNLLNVSAIIRAVF